MSGFSLRTFSGIAPKISIRLLNDTQAQVANNCEFTSGALTPLKANLAVTPDPITKTGTIIKIYRFGQDTISDLNYWFHWPTDIDICRGQTLGDTTERTYYTDGAAAKVTDDTLALSGGTEYPMNSYTLGVPPPSSPIIPNVTGTGTGLIESRYYTYTLVTAWGEESQPYNATEPALVEWQDGKTVTLTNLVTAPPSGYPNVSKKRIYRSATGSFGGAFMFVDEVPIVDGSYVDAVATDSLGEEIPSTSWAQPPAGLTGLVSMPNGMMAGFVGKDIYFCEPYKPYAWPLSYVFSVDHDIIALVVIDTTLVCLTNGNPYILQGTAPSNINGIKAPINQACVSKRSAAFLVGSAVYAAPDGLFAVSSNGPPVNMTENFFSNAEWNALFKPSSIHGYVYDNRYIGFYDTGTVSGGFILDPAKGSFSTFDGYATAGYYDPVLDSLFLVISGALYKFAKSTSNLTATWQTKEFYSPRPLSLSAIRVEAETYPLTAYYYVDNILKSTKTILSNAPSRLPGGFTGNSFSVKVVSSGEVYSLTISEAIGDMKNG